MDCAHSIQTSCHNEIKQKNEFKQRKKKKEEEEKHEFDWNIAAKRDFSTSTIVWQLINFM